MSNIVVKTFCTFSKKSNCTHCGASDPSKPVFNGKKIYLQSISQCQQVYSAAAIGAVEARFSDDDEVLS